jgi:hypothetical protein
MREQSTLHEVLNAMHDIMLAERASFAVPANGRGGFMFTNDSPNPFDPNDNSGLMKTDKLVLVFEEGMLFDEVVNSLSETDVERSISTDDWLDMLGVPRDSRPRRS